MYAHTHTHIRIHMLNVSSQGVIVENTFTSINDMVLVLLGRFGVTKGHTYFKYFLMFYLTSKWRSAELAAEISVPILYISGLSVRIHIYDIFVCMSVL